MLEPAWNDPTLRAGTMVRAALWLTQEVGEGNTFTKEQLRAAFPGVAQADRRVRDLRDFGWVIDTSSSDAALSADEQRFAGRGVEVWNSEERRKSNGSERKISSKERAEALAASGFQCAFCGIAGGEAYPENQSEVAVLAVSRQPLEGDQGSESDVLVVECRRCRSGAVVPAQSIPKVRDLLEELTVDEKVRLLRWAKRGTRSTTPLDRAWNALRLLPTVDRAELLKGLE